MGTSKVSLKSSNYPVIAEKKKRKQINTQKQMQFFKMGILKAQKATSDTQYFIMLFIQMMSSKTLSVDHIAFLLTKNDMHMLSIVTIPQLTFHKQIILNVFS